MPFLLLPRISRSIHTDLYRFADASECMDWAEKYRPKRLQDLVGNAASIRQIVEWAKTWSPSSKPLILYGKPGTGKTSTVYALANDLGWEVVEMNASDQRTKASIERIAGSSSQTASLTGTSRKLIMLDEADHLQGSADRGGARAVIEVIKRTRQPIVLVANDVYALPPDLKARSELVQFKALQARSLIPRLKYIATMEGVHCTDEALRTIAEAAEGDVRAAVTMLYAAAVGRESLDAQEIASSQKDERSTIFQLITAIFSGRRDDDLMRQASDVGDTPDVVLQWIEGLLPALNDPKSIEDAYRCIARADQYIGLTYRRQFYTLWRYANALMLVGVAEAADGRGIHTRIMPPARWKRMGSSRRQREIRGVLLRKISARLHIPQSTIRESYMTLLSMLAEVNPSAIAADLELDAEELSLFLHDRARATEVIKSLTRRTENTERASGPKSAHETTSGSKNQSSLFDGFARRQ